MPLHFLYEAATGQPRGRDSIHSVRSALKQEPLSLNSISLSWPFGDKHMLIVKMALSHHTWGLCSGTQVLNEAHRPALHTPSHPSRQVPTVFLFLNLSTDNVEFLLSLMILENGLFKKSPIICVLKSSLLQRTTLHIWLRWDSWLAAVHLWQGQRLSKLLFFTSED